MCDRLFRKTPHPFCIYTLNVYFFFVNVCFSSLNIYFFSHNVYFFPFNVYFFRGQKSTYMQVSVMQFILFI